MINVFPKIYEDELLYSAVSRYRRMCGLLNKRAIMEDLYGKKQGVFQMLFPLHLNKICEMLPFGSKITGEQLLLKHTMYPFYSKFLSKPISDDIKTSMLKEANVSIMVKTCLHSRETNANKYLKYCHLCVAEDKENLGESYWRREQQFNGVFFCRKHGIELQESKILMTKINNEYACLDDIEITTSKSIDEECKKYNLKYIKLVKEVIDSDDKRLNLIDINRFYKYRLYELGLASKCGHINRKKLFEKFREFYSKQYLKLMKSNLNDSSIEESWIYNFFSNKHNKSIVKHILLLQFLGSSVEEMFNLAENITFKKSYYKKELQVPKLNLDERKKQWLKIINENPNNTRSELMNIDRVVYNYICKYDREWYHKVTPKNVKKHKGAMIDWKKRDKELLKKVKVAVVNIKNKEGNPIRICMSSIKREVSVERKLDNIKLIKTRKYIDAVNESKEEFLIRKIKWGINEMLKEEEPITRYKLQVKCGITCYREDEMKRMIENIIADEIKSINNIRSSINTNKV